MDRVKENEFEVNEERFLKRIMLNNERDEANKTHKTNKMEGFNSLSIDSVKSILSFVGNDDYLFAGTVCKEWNGIHEGRTTSYKQLTTRSCMKEAIPNSIPGDY